MQANYTGKQILSPVRTAKHKLYQRPNLQNNPNPWTVMTVFGGRLSLRAVPT